MKRAPRTPIVLVTAVAIAFAPACSLLNGVTNRVRAGAHKQSGPDAVTEALEESAAIARRDAAKARTAPPDAVAEELLTPLQVRPPGEVEAFDQRFDLTVSDAPAREFFMSLVEGTPYNMVLDPEVDGVVTLALKNVTIDEVVQAVRDVYGYEYEKTTYGYHILPAGLQTRIFELNYLNIQRSGSSSTLVSSGQSSGGGSSDSDDGSSSSSSSSSSGGGVSGSQISTSSATDFWSELDEILRTIVVGGESSVAISPSAGVVIVRGVPAELRAVEEYLNKAQLNLQRQVILEAKILEVRLSDRFQSGIDWALILDSTTNPIIRAIQTGGGTILDAAAVSEIADNLGFLDRGALNVPDPTGGAIRPDKLFGGVFTASAQFEEFTTLIELLEKQGSVRTLSSPRVSTVNNQKAVIKVGQDEFFVTDVSSTTVTGTTTTTTPQVELTPFFSGIALDVTPQISSEGAVILHIHPTISEVTDQNKIVTVGTDDLQLPVALSTIRESDSVVRARSGQVIVIGGLMQETTRNDRAGIPWFGRIPIIGFLFRQQLDRLDKTELVLLLRAVLVEADTWKKDIKGTMDRVDELTNFGMSGSGKGQAKQGQGKQ